MKIAIIGGGMAGLPAALDLSAAGHHVTVFEKYPSLGGLASTFEMGPTRLERFYHHVFSTDLDFLGLVKELGLWNQLKWFPEFNASYYDGKIYPFSPAWKILLFSALSPLDRLRLAFVSKWISLKKDHRPYEQVTAKEFILKTMGERVWRVMWEPLFTSKFGAHTDQISMTWFFGRLTARFGPSLPGAPKGHLGYLMGSTQVLVDALEAKLKSQNVELRVSSGVKKLVYDGGKVSGVESRAGFEAFDQVLVTCATPLFLEIGGEGLPADLRASLEQFKYHGSVVAVLEMDKPASPAYWVNILDKSVPFLAVIEQTKMISPEHYGGRHVLYVAKYLDTNDPFFSAQPQAVLAEFYGHLKKVLPNFQESSVTKAHVMRADYTQPIVTRGYGALIPPHRLPVKNLYLANMTQIYPEDRGMSYSIKIGRRVARMMMEDARG